MFPPMALNNLSNELGKLEKVIPGVYLPVMFQQVW